MSIDWTQLWNSYALQYAAYGGHLDIVTWLLDVGAEVRFPFGAFGSALNAAVAWKKSYHPEELPPERLKIVELLLSKGADVNAVLEPLPVHPLLEAVRSGHLEAVESITQEFVIFCTPLEAFDQALACAADNDEDEILQLLLQMEHQIAEDSCNYALALAAHSLAGRADHVRKVLEWAETMRRERTPPLRWEFSSAFPDESRAHYKAVNAKGVFYQKHQAFRHSPLHTAYRNGYAAVVQLFLDHGADLGDPRNEEILGACLNHHELANTLLARGFDVNAGSGHALRTAAYDGDAAFVDLLLSAGADINLSTPSLGTALISAAYRSKVDIVRTLLARGASLDHDSTNYGTAVHAAAYGSSMGDRSAVLSLLFTYHADVNSVHPSLGTPIYIAIQRGDVNAARTLLDYGADPHPALERSTPVETAISRLIDGPNELTALLLTHSTYPLSSKDYSDLSIPPTVLLATAAGGVPAILSDAVPAVITATAHVHSNSRHSRLSVISHLLAAGADVNAITSPHHTALQASKGKLPVLTFLLEAGADPNLVGGVYGTAASAAAHAGRIDGLELLLRHGADLSLRGGSKYDSPLQAAAACWYVKDALATVQFLLERGADVNETGGKLGTAVRAAVDALPGSHSRAPLLWFLAECGADMTREGESLTVAIEKRDPATAHVLLDCGVPATKEALKAAVAIRGKSRRHPYFFGRDPAEWKKGMTSVIDRLAALKWGDAVTKDEQDEFC